MPDLHEFISFQFKGEFGLAEQERTMAALEPLMTVLPGLKLRESFYSEVDHRWITRLVWESEEVLETSTAAVEENPAAMELFGRFDSDSMRYARYRLMASATGPSV